MISGMYETFVKSWIGLTLAHTHTHTHARARANTVIQVHTKARALSHDCDEMATTRCAIDRSIARVILCSLSAARKKALFIRRWLLDEL